VVHVRQSLDVSERRACRATKQPRSTQRSRARSAGVAESLIGVRASTKSPTARGAADGSAW
jgi:hypothetical protein